TVLLADDDEAVLDTVATILKRLGCKVLVATDGLSAVETFKTHHTEIELVLLDVVMPKMGGIDAFKKIRKMSPSMKVIFLTGYDSHQRLSSQEMGIEKVITKPFNVSKFSCLLNSVLTS
ncbi:MAG TPA: response regulator, partial [Mariprofundaceae bacterium]|nr:response regulator [Mariprofundaceae bacterium]